MPVSAACALRTKRTDLNGGVHVRMCATLCVHMKNRLYVQLTSLQACMLADLCQEMGLCASDAVAAIIQVAHSEVIGERPPTSVLVYVQQTLDVILRVHRKLGREVSVKDFSHSLPKQTRNNAALRGACLEELVSSGKLVMADARHYRAPREDEFTFK